MRDNSANTMLRRIASTLLDSIFPVTCSLCNAHGSFICDACLNTLPKRDVQHCGACGVREMHLGTICKNCIGTVAHDGVFAIYHYDHRAIAHLIHLFKYRFIKGIGEPLGSQIGKVLTQTAIPFPDAILPVPLHPKRKRWRGWNQAEILTESLLKNLPPENTPVFLRDRLIRIRFTAPQMSLSQRADRQENIRNAFQIKQIPDQSTTTKHNSKKHEKPFDIAGKRLWIVDDVTASGSTISACAQVLKEAGAREVIGIVLAR